MAEDRQAVEVQGEEQKKHSLYKGFAYTKNTEKPQIVFGDTKEEIFELLDKWNKARKVNVQYENCNIGKLNPESQKYENYEKYNVHTRERIKKNIYLETPQNLSKEEFDKVIKELKEKGAKYNFIKHRWYIPEDQKDKFAEYLPKGEVQQPEMHQQGYTGETPAKVNDYSAAELQKAIAEQEQKNKDLYEIFRYRVHEEDMQGYVQEWREGSKRLKELIAKQNELLAKVPEGIKQNPAVAQEPPVSSEKIYLEIPRLSKDEFQTTIQFFKENGAKFDGEKKQWHISSDLKEKFKSYIPAEDTLPTVNYEYQQSPVVYDGKTAVEMISDVNIEHIVEVELSNGERLRINGDDVVKKLGVQDWNELNVMQILGAVETNIQEHFQILDEMQVEELPEDLQIGDMVTVYVPEYKLGDNGYKYVCGIKEVFGELKELTADRYIIEDETGSLKQVNPVTIYDEQQAEVMKQALSEKFSTEQLDLIGNSRLSGTQMEQVYRGLKEGLSIYQAAMYANPTYSTWEMDVYRYGMSNGISFDDVQAVIKNHSIKTNGWDDSKKMVDRMVKAQRNLIIKDMRANKISPERQLVKKMERLNGLTGKMHSVRDIMQSLKDGAVPDGEVGKLMGTIGKDVKYQWKMMEKALHQTPLQAPVR